MKFPNLGDTLKFLGDNKYVPIIAVCSVAFFRGIFRPIFTMMDKKSDHETKKFAAIREGLTEGVAIPVYMATPFLIEKGIINNLFKKEAAEAGKTIKTIRTNASFVSTCIAALIIPAICNLVQPPIMKKIKKLLEKPKPGLDINVGDAVAKATSSVASAPSNITNKPYQTSLLPINKINSGMKVGG